MYPDLTRFADRIPMLFEGNAVNTWQKNQWWEVGELFAKQLVLDAPLMLKYGARNRLPGTLKANVYTNEPTKTRMQGL